jgi:hypothetical protein
MAALILKGKIREMHKVNAFFKKIKIKIDYGDVESFMPCLKTKQTIDILGEGKIIKDSSGCSLNPPGGSVGAGAGWETSPNIMG